MRTKTALTTLVAIAMTATTIHAQMGEDDWGERRGDRGERGDRRGLHGRGGRFGKDGGEGRRPGMGRGPGADRQPPMEMVIGRLLQNPEAREKLGITEDQVNAIKTGTEDIRTRMHELGEEMRSAAEEQVKLLQAETVDEEAVMAAVQKTGNIRTEIAKLRVKGLILVKSTLSADQVAKIKEFMHSRRHRGRGPRKGEGGEQRRPRERGERGQGWGRHEERGEGDGIRGGWRDRDRDRDREREHDAGDNGGAEAGGEQ